MTATETVSNRKLGTAANGMSDRWQLSKRSLFTCILAILLPVVLFSEYFQTAANPLRILAQEIAITCTYPATQWMIVLCFVVYLAMFLVLEARSFGIHWCRPAIISLVAFLTLLLPGYIFDYGRDVHSTQIPVLLSGMVLGKAVAAWAKGLQHRK